MRDEVNFYTHINVKIFYKLVLPILVGVVRHVQIASQIVEFLDGQYLKKDMKDCLDFLQYRKTLKTVNQMQQSLKFNILSKKCEVKFIFYLQINMKVLHGPNYDLLVWL